jgi:hypothetical protein
LYKLTLHTEVNFSSRSSLSEIEAEIHRFNDIVFIDEGGKISAESAMFIGIIMGVAQSQGKRMWGAFPGTSVDTVGPFSDFRLVDVDPESAIVNVLHEVNQA